MGATIREMLTEKGFDWKHGTIVWQGDPDWRYSLGCTRPVGAYILNTDPRLDEAQSLGFGGATVPLFIAQDRERIYFMDQYDGAQNLCSIFRDIESYVGSEEIIPVPGG